MTTKTKTAATKTAATKTAATKTAATNAEKRTRTISEGVRDSWKDKRVRALRTKRYGCEVDGTYYDSVRKAFTALSLPDSKHIKFRGQLRDAGQLKFGKHQFKIVPKQ